jgi:hypothetical protein
MSQPIDTDKIANLANLGNLNIKQPIEKLPIKPTPLKNEDYSNLISIITEINKDINKYKNNEEKESKPYESIFEKIVKEEMSKFN